MANTMNTAVTTGKVRLSYVHVFEPTKFEGSDEKYSSTILIPKHDTATKAAIDAAIEAAALKGVQGVWNGAKPAQPKTSLHDGDGLNPSGEEFGPECKGHWVLRANSNRQPQVVNRYVQEILDPSEIYSGVYAKVNVNFYAYNFKGSKGIACGLGPIQKIADGEPLGGQVRAADVFSAVEIDPITGEPV